MDITTLAAAKTYTNNKLKEIINGGDASIVDPTLSLSGAAADAKITGDKIKELNTKLDNIELPDVPTKVSELDNDSKFITEKYYLDNREFYEDITFDNVFTLQTILDVNGFILTAKNDSFDFFNSLAEHYEPMEYKNETWYVVDKLITRYDKGEWLNFESGDDYLVLARLISYSDGYIYCQFYVYDHEDNRVLWCKSAIRDSEGNISYDWGIIGLNLDIIPIPDISGLSTINLDFEFYTSTSKIKKIDKKFVDMPTKVSELENDKGYITTNIIGDLSLLETVNKGSLIDAINEINARNLVTVSVENASVEIDEDGNNVIVVGGVTT